MSADGITPEMVEVGYCALAQARSTGASDKSTLCAVYAAMLAADERFAAFETETLGNLGEVIQILKITERRIAEHLRRITATS